MYTNADCTVFNRMYDPVTRQDHWKATQIRSVFWEDCKAANTIKSGMENSDSAMVFIPFSVSAGYQKPKEFEKTPSGWTLRPEDYIVKGLVDYDGSVTKLLDHFDDVIVITSVDTMDYGSPDMQHWEVSGK